jgi:spore maturation protein CgeB
MRVTFYEPDAYERQRHRDIDEPAWAAVHVYENSADGLHHALECAQEADVVVKASGVGVFDRELESAVLDGPARRLTIFWDVDAPATLERLASDPDDPFRLLIPRYDLVLTYGGGDPVRRAYESLGARVCVPIYNALDAATHFPVPPDRRFACDLALLANRLPDRETRVSEFFLDVAHARPDKQFLLAGSGWHDKPTSANVKYLGHLYTADHNAFNCTAAAVLNVSRASMARFGYSPATRVFEAAGAGACLISDAWDGLELFLEPSKEVLVARRGEEVAAHLDCLTPSAARAIGEAARRRVLASHTYAHRATQVAALLNGGAVPA